MHDFNQVLTCWGIEPDDASIQKVISALKKRRALLCGMSLLFLLAVANNWEGRTTQILALGGTATLFVVALLTNTWRIRVLSRRQFVFFTQWLRNPFRGRR